MTCRRGMYILMARVTILNNGLTRVLSLPIVARAPGEREGEGLVICSHTLCIGAHAHKDIPHFDMSSLGKYLAQLNIYFYNSIIYIKY